MPIEVIDKIKQRNNGNFKLLDAIDVEMQNGQSLEEFLMDKRYHIGSTPPENANLLWIDTSESDLDESLDSIIIEELKSIISAMQLKMNQLEEDIEYFKIYGGTGGSNSTLGESFSILSEDGHVISTEEEEYIILENYTKPV